jgi:hypothetical protein
VIVLGVCVLVEPVVVDAPDAPVVPLVELLFASDVVPDLEVDEVLAAESGCLPNKLETSETRALTTPASIDTILPIDEVPCGSAANCVCALATMDSSDDRSGAVAAPVAAAA